VSFILDALKKSESERQRHAGPALFEVKTASSRAGLPPWAFALLALLAINLVALAWFVLRDPAPRDAATAGAATAAVPAPNPPLAAPVVADAAPAAGRPILPPSATTDAFAEGEDFVADEGATDEFALDDVAPTPGAGAAVSESVVVASPGASPAAPVSRGADDAPSIEELPASIVNQLPPLHLDLHVYGPRPSERFVMINMQRLREGDALPDGIRLDAITPTGAILSYRGNRFMLERD
jgi:general secretion pathway protein B